ncbi:hypothetical protein CEQ90_20405 [Lewinellaceae bacterium SD302]|nr:hypothetical protein CEQ90_20405 [Lewinellaceae bacterium SD302]
MRNLIFNLLVSIIPFFLCSCNDNTFEIHDGHWHLMKDNNGKEEDFVEEIPVNIYSNLVYSGYYRVKRHAIGEVIPRTKVIYLTLSGSIDSFEINFIENDSFALTSMSTGEEFSLTSVLDDFNHKEIDYINDKRVDVKFRENECEDKFSPSIYDLEIIIGTNQMDSSPYFLTVVEGEIINYLDPNKLKSIIEMKKVTLAEGSRDLIQPVIYLDDKLSYYCEIDVQNFFQSQGFNNVKTVSRNISTSKFSLCSRA